MPGIGRSRRRLPDGHHLQPGTAVARRRRITVRTKTLLVLCATLGLMVLALVLTSRFLLLSGFEALEEQVVRQDVRRAEAAIEADAARLEALCRDWATRKDTYGYLGFSDGSEAPPLVEDASYGGHRLNFVVVLDSMGDVVYGTGFDIGSGTRVEMPASLQPDHLAQSLSMLDSDAARTGTSGVAVLPESPAVVAAWPIQSQVSPSMPAGMLVIGHFLDSTELARMAASTELYHLTALPFDSDGLPDDFSRAVDYIGDAAISYVEPVSGSFIAGYTVMRDVEGAPAVVLKVDGPRRLYEQGVASMRYFLVFFVVVAGIFALVVLLGIERAVLSRLTKLREVVSAIGSSEAGRQHVVLEGSDELSEFAETLDGALTRLDESQVALQASELQFREVLENSVDVVYRRNVESGTYDYVSPSSTQVLGFTPEECIALGYDGLVARVHPDDRHLFDGEARNSSSSEYRLRHRDGEYRWISDTCSVLRDDSGRSLAVVGSLRDVTERKQGEEQMLRSSRLASVGELASGVAHEVNNPLTGILGYAQLLLERDDLTNDARRDIETIQEESQRAARIVRNLLSFARQRSAEKSAFDLNEMIVRTLELREYRLRSQGTAITLDLSGRMAEVPADYHQLQQVVLNLVMNAEHAVGGLGREGKIAVATRCSEHEVAFSVSDNGPGVAGEVAARIFDPFFTTKPVGQGTGLGLSICHSIVAAHGGSIEVANADDGGAVFTVRLPRTAPLSPGAGDVVVAPEEQHDARRAARILVADDEATIRDLVARRLARKGWDVETASGGREAIERLRSVHVDACVIDYRMPDISGEELYRRICQEFEYLKDRVLIITGDTSGAEAREMLRRLDCPVLAKPFSSEELLSKVTGLLR